MKRALPILAALLCILAASCSQPTSVEPLGPDAVILAFGDSVTYGTGARQGQDYPQLLSEKTGLQVVNAGIPGDTAARAKTRIDAALEQYSPDLVILELGGNDFLARQRAAQVKSDLREIILAVQRQDIAVILVAVPEFSVLRASAGMLKDSSLYRQLGDELGVPVVAELFADILSDENLVADPIHPNAQGYRAMAEGIQRFLLEQGFIQ